MNKFVSTIIIAAFVSVCSFGVIAGSPDDKNQKAVNKDTSEYSSKQDKDKDRSGSTSKEGEMREKSLSERKSESSEQEVMNEKPYKQ